eukprot:TRINITY_DN17378_c1_g1_i3.p2 TRINITY_DN17378_c1_g1~~TRINITY_DN17378_c1_g1_i3.p2  ORF type:complete len:152 (+),score=27.36 TRINITY_DN17378_c1_g1_i3:63-518(+)
MKSVFILLAVFVGLASACSETNPLSNNYCYLEYDSSTGQNVEYTCICPWSTCERNSNNQGTLYSCNLTGFAIGFSVVGSILICVAVGLCIFCCIRSGRCCCYRAPQTQVNHIYTAQPVYGATAQPVYGGATAQPYCAQPVYGQPVHHAQAV